MLYLSFVLSRILRRPVHAGMPMALSIEPTTACNLRCPECPSGLRSFTRDTGSLKKELFKSIIDEASRHLASLTFYFQGEPFINPDFLDMVFYAGEKGIYTMTSTNGHFLTEKICHNIIDSGLDRIIISIDGTTQEVYETYRKQGNLDTVLEGTKNLIKTKKARGVHHPYVIFQFLVVKPNEHQIDEVKMVARDIGVDELKFKTAQLYNYKNGHNLIPLNEKYSRYRRNGENSYELKQAIRNECWKQWHSAVFTWDGNLLPCCFDKDANHAFGNIKAEPYADLWKNNSAREFRKLIFKGRDQIDICANCSEGCKVWT
jgi:radical SAM protein with 4Fe4S-binding SPASM domain